MELTQTIDVVLCDGCVTIYFGLCTRAGSGNFSLNRVAGNSPGNINGIEYNKWESI